MDKAMLDVFVDHYNKGDRAQNGCKPHVYTAAVKNVRDKCDKQITKDHIISRSKTFDKYFLVIDKMLSQSGFGWDCDRNMISVDSDDVWNNYVKANKEAASYRFKVIKYWDMISVIYSRDRATGVAARTAGESGAEMAGENASNKDKDDDDESSTQTGEGRKKKRYRSDDSVACMLGEKLDSFTAAFRADVSEPPPKPASPEEILAVLNAIPRLEEDDLLAVYDILVSDDRKFKSLKALPDALKKKWVIKQVHQ